MKILFDTCIIIDALQSRERFAEEAQGLFKLVAVDRIDGYITAKSMTDIYYLMHSFFHDKILTMNVINKLIALFNIVDTTASDIMLAMSSDVPDYEEAIMAESAKRCNLDGIVTRDKHFGKADVAVYNPSQLLQ